MLVGTKIVKQHCCLDCLFALLKSACVKAACRTLMKFTSSTISQNFACQAKRRRLTEFAKKNCHSISSIFCHFKVAQNYAEICQIYSPFAKIYLPFARCSSPKKVFILFEIKSCANMLVKLTPIGNITVYTFV